MNNRGRDEDKGEGEGEGESESKVKSVEEELGDREEFEEAGDESLL